MIPDVILQYEYRRLFGLSAKEMEEEPMDKLFTNWYIYSQIQKAIEFQQRMNNKHG